MDDVDALKKRIAQSLEDARSELSPADRTVVSELWEKLQLDL